MDPTSSSSSLLELPVLVVVVLVSVLILTLFLFKNFRFSSISSSTKTEDKSKSLAREELTSNDIKKGQTQSPSLHPVNFTKFSILKITQVSHNTKLLRFEIPFGKKLGLPIGRHLSVRAEIDGTNVTRAYTPVSKPDQDGYFDLLVKSYEFGKLSSFLHELKTGDSVDIRGPIGRFKYEKNKFSRIGLIAGGTGLTPCLQLMRCILEGEPDDKSKFVLFFQNRTEEDILLRDEIDTLVTRFPDRVQVLYFLSNSKSTKFGSVTNEIKGYISQKQIDSLMNPSLCPLVCLCGPSGFNDAMKKLLIESGHSDQSLYVW